MSMEAAIWVLIGLVCLIGWAIENRLKAIEGKLLGIQRLLTDEHGSNYFNSYGRMSAGYLGAINNLIQQELDRASRNRT